jgi:SAM-dependent methyltransferase
MPEQLDLARDALDVALARDLDQVADWSLDSELTQALPPGSFDHVIFGDVLEHLYDPARALAQAVQRLRPKGSALVCIPNVQHWSVLAQLILGHWPQQDAGLFDRTHIRWFTLQDMVHLLQGAGLVVERVVPRIFQPEAGQPLLQALSPAAKLLGVDPDKLQKLALPLQYVLVGRKPG